MCTNNIDARSSLKILLSPHAIPVLLSYSETRNTHVVRDVIDDQRTEPNVEEQRKRKRHPNEDCGAFQSHLNDGAPDYEV